MLVQLSFFHGSPLTTFCLNKESIINNLCHHIAKLWDIENLLFLTKNHSFWLPWQPEVVKSDLSPPQVFGKLKPGSTNMPTFKTFTQFEVLLQFGP